MTTRRASRLGWAAALALVVLATGLSACGKRGKLEPPKDEKKAYTYPLFYPAPDSVVPSAELPAEEIMPAGEPPPPDEEPFPEERRRKRPLSPAPTDFERTRTETFR